MEVTGARWSFDNAEAVLKLWPLIGCGDFSDYAAYRLRQEKIRNNDSGYPRIVACLSSCVHSIGRSQDSRPPVSDI